MQQRSAWVTITAKVFVPDDELQDLVAKGKASLLSPDDTVIENEQDAFDFLAREKIRDFIKTDEPLKYSGVDIDLTTLE
jgi:hypothetical protein